jgi:hypothetical protein
MRKNTYKFALDTKLPSQFVQPRVVNGDTSNVFEITLTDKGKAISLSNTLDKIVAVFRRADGLVYTQDEETGITRKTTNTISIDVHRDSFRTGQNTVDIAIFSREDDETEEYAGQITTCQGFFTARNENLSDNPQGSLPQLPMLEQLIADATAAIAAANAAAAAANAATALVKLNGMPYLLTPTNVTRPTATSIDCGVEQTYAEIMATHTDTVYRPLCIVLDGYLLYERSYENRGDAGLMVTMTADTGMGTSINATLVAQSRFGGIVGITALYESASSDTGGYGNGLYVVHHGGQEQDSSASSDAGEYDYGFTTMTEESKGDILAAMNAGAALAYVYNDYHNERDITFYETNRYTETRQRFNSTTMETETYEVTIVRMTLYDREGAYDGYAELGISDSNTVYVSGAYKAQFVEVV